jgi:hypothetical protein
MRNSNCCRIADVDASSFWSRIAGVLILSSACFASARQPAAPISFHFDATIGTVYDAIPFDSGLNFALGDTISGEFSFDPVPGDGSMLFDSHQPHEFSFNINGAIFTSPNFEIEAVNNAPISDFDLASIVDILRVGAGGLLADVPTNYPNLDPQFSNFRMTLYGPFNSSTQASVPPEAADWNSFNLWRSIEVSFGDGKGHSVGFQAFVAPFSEIPEPTAEAIAWLAIGSLFGVSSGLQRRICRRRQKCCFKGIVGNTA